ncbi:helix-turn-helix domain protein [Vibrio phage 1.079.O._10N.286.45.E9]|nr:helix-turn-helix domain protein [Vibrio phage 1.079.O._10N.286.45.E9]
MKKHMMRKSSTDIINWLNCIWLTDLPANSKYLACYLRKFMNSNHDMAWPSYARIIEETGLSRATVAKYIKILESEGWINRQSGNSTTNTVYFAVLPKIINDEVKEFDDRIQAHLKGSTSAKLRSTSAKQGVVREVNTNTQLNKQSNNQYTDISKADEHVFLEDIKHEYQLTFCQDAINELELINDKNYTRKSYTGALKVSEWEECESAMRSVDDFDMEYFTWWMEEKSPSMRKIPSLPNMLTDMNGTPFDQFYDSTFMQEWE